MELKELYNSIQNPIDDPNVIDKLINAYANRTKGGYYSQLTRNTQKEYNKGQYYTVDSDSFHAMLFNKWKNSIVGIKKSEYMQLRKQGSYNDDFIKMRDFLKNIPDVSTKAEAKEVFYGKKDDQELADAIEKYSWESLSENTGWVHVCSRYLTAKKDDYPNVEHRLYLNTESIDTYKVAKMFIEKCDERHLPYYFKYDEYANRDDTIVIYSSTENLGSYVEILKEIKTLLPDSISRCKEPPILTGRIDGWIGYGSEPPKTPDGKHHSFNEVRANYLESTIDKITKEWILSNRNNVLTYHGEKYTLQDYIAMKATESMLERFKETYLREEKYGKKDEEKRGIPYNPENVRKKLGYDLEALQRTKLKQNMYYYMKDKMNRSLTEICNGAYKDMEEIKVTINNGEPKTFSGSDMEMIISELSLKINKNDPNYSYNIQNELRNNAKQNGFDADKFCFDIKARDKILSYSSNKQKETKIESNNVNMSSLDSGTILNIIDKDLLNKKMKIPNGNEISAKQYIQEIVFPHLPENGLVIMDNGSIIKTKNFIEEFVFKECQEKYNGDFPKYMAEKTRNNFGTITVEKGNDNNQINPVSIIDYINPFILEKSVKLPNGVEITAKQYIQEVFSSHIPSNGFITLNNGIEIPAVQYIEDILFGVGQNLYKGDIAQILFFTTRNNKGTITADTKEMKDNLINIVEQANKQNNEHINKLG